MRQVTVERFLGVDERIRLATLPEYASSMKNLRISEEMALTKGAVRRLLCSIDGVERIEGIWCGKLSRRERIVVSADGSLYNIYLDTDTQAPEYVGKIGTGKCCMFEYNGALYIMKENFYGKFDGVMLMPVVGHVPCIATNCTPSGGGEPYERVNLLNTKRRQLFSTVETAVSYKLAESNVYIIESVKVDGEPYQYEYTLEPTIGRLDLEKPIPDGINNLEVIYMLDPSKSQMNKICKCTHAMVFGSNSDERIFLWGNEDCPTYRFHSELTNGTETAEYFPVDGYTVIGNDHINCITQQYNKQLIFAEQSAFYSYCELRNDALGNTYASFPVFNLNGAKGCLVKSDGCIVDNKPVTLCNDGLNFWESSSIENEKNTVCFSDRIEKSLKRAIESKADVSFFDFQAQNEFYFVCDGKAYIYNYAQKSWYIYDGFYGENFTVLEQSLYFTHGNGIYVLADSDEGNEPVECEWTSPYLTLAQETGRCDVNGFEADLRINGDVNIKITFETSDGSVLTEREMRFDKDGDSHLRISLRPSLKRVMPFRIRLNTSGNGDFTLYNMTLKTRKKERSRRNGIQ